MIAYLSETDFLDNQIPKRLDGATFRPCGQYVQEYIENAQRTSPLFGMPLVYLDNQNWENAVREAQCPIICCKALTVLQGFGAIASRTLLPSSDMMMKEKGARGPTAERPSQRVQLRLA